MPFLGIQHRNHSFPPSFRFTQKTASETLAPPEPEIHDKPWAHFLSPTLTCDDAEDFIDFTAGIITSPKPTKRKHSKFRPSNANKWNHKVINYHHGTFQRPEEQHEFVENRSDPWSHVVENDLKTPAEPTEQANQVCSRGRSKTRTMSAHRHSWREPSADLFTVEEEVLNDHSPDESTGGMNEDAITHHKHNNNNNDGTPLLETNGWSKL